MKIIETRNELMTHFSKEMVVGELGVFKGEFSEVLYNTLKPKELYLVDIWKGQFGSGDKDGKNHTVVDDMEVVYNGLKEKYAPTPEVKLVRSDTQTFLLKCPNNSFDLIYVDADHTYQAVLNDLQLSFLKVKHGKFLTGHDYIQGGEVYAAVNNFCYVYQQKISAITKDGCPSFVIQVEK